MADYIYYRSQLQSSQLERNNVDRLLLQSFRKLAAEKPVGKITIREITDRAGVIRPTFYNHFQDKYELLEWIVKTDITNVVRNGIGRRNVRKGVIRVLQNMIREKEFYMSVSRTTGQNSFQEILFSAIKKLILIYERTNNVGTSDSLPWLTPDRAASCRSTALCFLLMEWIKEGMPLSPEEMADVLLSIAAK